jgi:hypothetical protein
MMRILAAIGLALLVATPVLAAQSRCAQVRQAVATYGYASARRYALAHYGIQAVRYGDRCLKGAQSRSHVHSYGHYARYHYTRYHDHYAGYHHTRYHDHYARRHYPSRRHYAYVGR